MYFALLANCLLDLIDRIPLVKHGVDKGIGFFRAGEQRNGN